MTAEAITEPNREALEQHIQMLSARWDELSEPAVMEFRALDGDEKSRNKYARFDVRADTWRQDALEWALAMNAAKLNIYVTVNPVRANVPVRSACGDKDILGMFYAFIDCDDEAATKNYKELDITPKRAFYVVTGTIPFKRPHIYWELEKPEFDHEAWRDIQKRLAARIKSDGSVHNPSRIMRLGGSITWPDAKKQARGYVSEVVTYHDADRGAPVPLKRLQALFPATSHAAPGQSPSDGGFEFDAGPQAMDRALAAANIQAGDEWHNNVVRLVGSYVAKGLSDSEIHAITDNFTQGEYTIDQTRDEVQKAIDGARQKGFAPTEYADPAQIGGERESPQAQDIPSGNEDKQSGRNSRLEWFDDLGIAQASNYLIKGVLDREAMSVIYGPSNSGKTFFALDMAFHIATETPWRGNRMKGGGVLYLAAEGGRGVVNRVVALRQETGCVDVPLAIRRAGLDLLKSTADLQEVVDLAAEVNARAPLALIVIDTLSRVMAGGDENGAADMTALIKNIDRIREITGAHIMIVHHSGKDAARGARGHSSLRAATDTEIEVQEEEGNRAAQVQKQRDNQGGELFGFSLKSIDLGVDQDGDPITSCIVESADADEFVAQAKLRKGLGKNAKIIADSFDQLIAEGVAKPNLGGIGMPEAGQFWAVRLDDLRQVSMGKMTSANPRQAWKDAIDALVTKRSLFVVASETVWAVDRKVK